MTRSRPPVPLFGTGTRGKDLQDSGSRSVDCLLTVSSSFLYFLFSLLQSGVRRKVGEETRSRDGPVRRTSSLP